MTIMRTPLAPVNSRAIGSLLIALFFVSQFVFLPRGGAQVPVPTVCTSQKVRQVLSEATESELSIKIDCHLNLSSTDPPVTKVLVLEGPSATGVQVNCNGAHIDGGKGTVNYLRNMIQVKSEEITDPETGIRTWRRPQDITIRNCNISGSIGIWGMTEVFSEDLRASSISSEHTTTVRNYAPRRITFDNIVINGVGRIPLYLSPGVTYVQLINSKITGRSNSVAIYLDAESCCNTLKNNDINVKTSERSVLAIDGSSYNKIMDNRFSGLNHGGIYMYRNCGERGVVRHATPSHNMILNNIFFYNKYKGGNPSVYLGSRNGRTRKGHYGYCGKDKGYPFGSSESDLDYARYNVVMQNQIYKRSIEDMIKSKGLENNSPNHIGYNQTVTAESVENNRLAGCYVENGYGTKFISHGESIEVLENANGEPVRVDYKYMCNDGELSRSSISASETSKVSFDCYVTGSNDGCNKIVHCPIGQKAVDAKAACNLEYGIISNDVLDSIPINMINISVVSDKVSSGICYVADNSLQSGQKTITGVGGLDRVSLGCKEHDKNGGDCHIKGTLFCR